MCVCTSWRGCLQRGQRRLWSKLLSMQFLQKVWPQGVVTGSKNSLQKTRKGWERRLRWFWRVCVGWTLTRGQRQRRITDLMQRGHSKSETVRTARVFSLPGFRSPDREKESVFPKRLLVLTGTEIIGSQMSVPLPLPSSFLAIISSSSSAAGRKETAWQRLRQHSLPESCLALEPWWRFDSEGLHSQQCTTPLRPCRVPCTCCACLLPLLFLPFPVGWTSPSWWAGPWVPLRLVMGQGSLKCSDTSCKMQDNSSGTSMPSASRICSWNIHGSIHMGICLIHFAYINRSYISDSTVKRNMLWARLLSVMSLLMLVNPECLVSGVTQFPLLNLTLTTEL